MTAYFLIVYLHSEQIPNSVPKENKSKTQNFQEKSNYSTIEIKCTGITLCKIWKKNINLVNS